MKSFNLMSKADVLNHVANLFTSEAGFSKCKIKVCVEHVFQEKTLTVGEISLQTSEERDTGIAASLISHGAFEWKVPTDAEISKEINNLLSAGNNKNDGTTREVLRNLTKIAARSGLLNPTFDPQDIEDMPFAGSTTIVADTSGILSGALDFIVRHFPAVRIKVPAIVHMEIVNMRDRFRTFRKRLMSMGESQDAKKSRNRIRNRLLLDRLKAEGGARVLLRLELQAPTEVERTYLLGDPLRSAFEHDRHSDIRDLDIRKPQREYADRLILESARHHQAQSGPKHAVRLLTGDQLLASMALAEGVLPIFIRDFQNEDFFGQRFAGQMFDPFTGNLRRTSLLAILWELTFTFGEVRVYRSNNNYITLRAINPNHPWSTYHVVDDLLWCCPSTSANSSGSTAIGSTEARRRVGAAPKDGHAPEATAPADLARSQPTRVGFQKFDVNRLIELILSLDDNQYLALPKVVDILRTRSISSYQEYERFLRLADFVSVVNDKWYSTDKLEELSAALRNERVWELRELLLSSPSFKHFKEIVDAGSVGTAIPTANFHGTTRTYKVLGEITHIAASVGKKGLFPTPTTPDVHSFAKIALERFSELNDGADLVLTGQWLESLIQVNGIHPEIARLCLDAASLNEVLYRSTEGSTAHLRNPNHNVHVLRIEDGQPMVKKIFLYRGDYLVKGKGSVSLRIRDAES